MKTVGAYELVVTIGSTVIPIQPQMIQELTISQDIDQLLPMFKMAIREPTGLLGEVIPYDKDANTITLKVTGNTGEDNSNEFKFVVKRRRTGSAKEYVVEGVLSTPGLLDPSRTRALTGSVQSSLATIAGELDNIDTELGASLNFNKSLLQPTWTNAQLLRHLKTNLLGVGDQSCFCCFIKNVRGRPILVFKSLDELIAQEVRFNFMIGHKQYEDFRPVSEYHIIDSSQFLGDFGAPTQIYRYFDYDTGVFTNSSIGLTTFPSLAEQFLINKDTNIQGTNFVEGRSNDFTDDFVGKRKNGFYGKINGLVNMWISTWGTENIAPGDIVKVFFNEAFAGGDFYLYQHSGYWLVKKVVHILTTSFMTNILLTRSGIDSSIENTLLPAERYKK
ncbi:MAG: hypothetical protein IMZ47_02270 [Firmicutes bacterium]|nr:hypothetical protein [Bacillota bacterium]